MRASGACFNCGNFDHKVKDCPNVNNAPSSKTEGSVHKHSVNTPQLIKVQGLEKHKEQVQEELIKIVYKWVIHALTL